MKSAPKAWHRGVPAVWTLSQMIKMALPVCVFAALAMVTQCPRMLWPSTVSIRPEPAIRNQERTEAPTTTVSANRLEQDQLLARLGELEELLFQVASDALNETVEMVYVPSAGSAGSAGSTISFTSSASDLAETPGVTATTTSATGTLEATSTEDDLTLIRQGPFKDEDLTSDSVAQVEPVDLHFSDERPRNESIQSLSNWPAAKLSPQLPPWFSDSDFLPYHE
eukprot:g56632.t1